MKYFDNKLNKVLTESFLNVRDLSNTINNEINPHLVKLGISEGNTYYVTIGPYRRDENKIVIELYIGHNDPKKLTSVVEYYLKEHGVEFGPWRVSVDGDSLISDLISFDRMEDESEDDQVLRTIEATKLPEERVRTELAFYKKRIDNGELISIRDIGYEIEPGIFKLNRFIDEVDMIDLDTLQGIWSVGKDKATGEIFAAYDGRYYDPSGESEYECLFLK